MKTSSPAERRELVRGLIEALEEDKELRYTLMGFLGFKELLDRFARLEERFAALEERQQRLEERFLKLEERFAALEERVTKLEERFADLEERFVKLEERFARLEERVVRLEERFAALEERVTRLEERMVRVEESLEALNKTVITIAHRFGVLSEYSFREAIKGIVEDLFGASAHRWTTYDGEGIVYGHPAVVEIDVVVADSRHLLVEVKSRVDTGDVLELVRIARLYEEKEGVKPELAIVAGFVTPKARELAERLGVKIYTYLKHGELALI